MRKAARISVRIGMAWFDQVFDGEPASAQSSQNFLPTMQELDVVRFAM
jgi:hypothetical protein